MVVSSTLCIVTFLLFVKELFMCFHFVVHTIVWLGTLAACAVMGNSLEEGSTEALALSIVTMFLDEGAQWRATITTTKGNTIAPLAVSVEELAQSKLKALTSVVLEVEGHVVLQCEESKKNRRSIQRQGVCLIAFDQCENAVFRFLYEIDSVGGVEEVAVFLVSTETDEDAVEEGVDLLVESNTAKLTFSHDCLGSCCHDIHSLELRKSAHFQAIEDPELGMKASTVLSRWAIPLVALVLWAMARFLKKII